MTRNRLNRTYNCDYESTNTEEHLKDKSIQRLDFSIA